jgi:hypothetical protein
MGEPAAEERAVDDVERPEPMLPADIVAALRARGLPVAGETRLRQTLEARVPGYSLYQLPPAAVKRWKVRYRLMAADSYYDGQTASEAYARALLACSGEET